MTLSLILRFNLRLGSYSIWSASTSRTIYNQDFRAWPPHSLEPTEKTWKTTRCTRKKAQEQPKGCSDYLKYSKMPHQVVDACRTRLRRARGLVRPRAVGLLISIEYSRVRSCVLEPKRHGLVVVCPVWGDECRLDLVFFFQGNLVIALIAVEEG